MQEKINKEICQRWVEIDKLKVDSFLTVYPKNPPAIALYEKLGFTERRFEKDFYGEEEDRFVLTRKSLI